ncbi:MAG: Mu transposase C-terminal domain-containing protein [Syntrophobacteraceae bacterium]|nr:Mu transposase C-terminal domain-containing protein [Desulfobacteraceae bacterium]
MKESYSANDLAQILQLSVRAIQFRGHQGNWSFSVQPNPKGGGIVKLYHFASLPVEIQSGITTAWLRSHKIDAGANGSCNGNGRAEQLREGKMLGLLDYNKASDRDRELAHVWREIIGAYESATSPKNKRRISQGEFCKLFNERRIRVLAPDVYTHVKKVSVPTLWRAQREFEQKGIGGLLRKHEKERGPASLTEEQQGHIIGLIKDNPDVRPMAVHTFLQDQFGSVPHFTTIFRFMERWKAKNAQLYEYLRDPKAWKNKYQLAIGSRSENVERFCQVWEMDSTPADIECIDGRYTGIGLIDVFSRLPIVLITDHSKSSGIAAVMRRGMIEQGVPETIIKDHGKDYDSKHIQAVIASFNIESPWIPVRAPEYKPHIERFFGTLATGLWENLPGYIGHNVAQRQAIRHRERARAEFVKVFMTPGAVVKINMTHDELQAAVDKWIHFEYAQRPHKGLDGRLPAEMPGLSKSQVQRVPDERVLDLLLAPAEPRTVQKKGIEYGTGWYRSLDMGLHVGARVLVRPDLTDASRIFVFNLKFEYLFTAVDKTLDGLTPVQIATARKQQQKAVKASVKALGELKNAISQNPMLDRLDRLEQAGRNIAPIIRTEEFDNPAVQGAMRAVEDQLQIVRTVTDEQLLEQVEQITGYETPSACDEEELHAEVAELERLISERESGPSPIRFPSRSETKGHYEWAVDRYERCMRIEANGGELSAEDHGFARGFEAAMDGQTAEYWRLMKSMMTA